MGRISLSLSLSLSFVKNSQFVACPQFVRRFNSFFSLFFSDRFFHSFKIFKFLKFFNPFCSFFFVCKAKIHKFSVIANESQGEVWQSIVKNGFCRLPRKNSLTLIFARNDGQTKIQNHGNFFSKIQNYNNFYNFSPSFRSKCFQVFEKSHTKGARMMNST